MRIPPAVRPSPGIRAPTRTAPGALRADRPRMIHGIQTGDVTATRAVVWARADRCARMVVELAATPAFRVRRRVEGPVATAATDHTARVLLDRLPPATEVFCRVRFEDPDDPAVAGPPQLGRLRTAPARPADVRFAWSGDTTGQGFGIDAGWGGLRAYEAVRRAEPAFLLHCGDIVYADQPLAPHLPLPGEAGRISLPGGSGDPARARQAWRNLVTPAKAKVAETLEEFRGNHRYRLLDPAVRDCGAEVPLVAAWGDHETTAGWYPGQVLEDERYTVQDVDVLAARAWRAFSEYVPLAPQPAGRLYRRVAYGPHLDLFVLDLHSYRGPNGASLEPRPHPAARLLGSAQLGWLRRGLSTSRATWKVVAASTPVGVVRPDGRGGHEGIANGDDGPPLGRELEIAALLRSLHRRGVGDLVWLAAGVHYAAAHHYDPERAAFRDFTPFWEFTAGPLHAATFPAGRLDRTFGPRVVFQRAEGMPGCPPGEGSSFGEVHVAADTAVMTVRLRAGNGAVLHAVDLEPAERRRWAR